MPKYSPLSNPLQGTIEVAKFFWLVNNNLHSVSANKMARSQAQMEDNAQALTSDSFE